MILGFFFLGMGGGLLHSMNVSDGFNMIKITCFLVGFLLSMASSILIQKKIVNLEKEIDPLLNSNVYDVKFTEKFMDSSNSILLYFIN